MAMKEALIEGGVPPSMIWIEEESRSTYENALFSSEILRAHRVRHIALVVDADSMVRAEKCFQKQGLDVSRAACWIHTRGLRMGDLLPSGQAVSRGEVLLHEGLGILWYWLRGWI
jgi:uncharacterized SAM-binding protein YcdF (DUF218 family)